MKLWVGTPLGSTPASIDVQLYQNGEPYGDPVALNGTGGWQHTWFGLPTTDANGDEVTYYALETAVPPDYEANITNNEHEAVITNTYTGGVASIVVQKEWTGTQTPASIDVRVTGTNAVSQPAVRLGRGDPHRRGRLARRAAHRRRHAHPDLRRVEVVPEGYRQLDSTSSLSETARPRSPSRTRSSHMDLKVTKAWVDGGDASGQRPASVPDAAAQGRRALRRPGHRGPRHELVVPVEPGRRQQRLHRVRDHRPARLPRMRRPPAAPWASRTARP